MKLMIFCEDVSRLKKGWDSSFACDVVLFLILVDIRHSGTNSELLAEMWIVVFIVMQVLRQNKYIGDGK